MLKNRIKNRVLPVLICVCMGFSVANSYAWGKNPKIGRIGKIASVIKKYPVFLAAAGIASLGLFAGAALFGGLFKSSGSTGVKGSGSEVVKLPIVGGSEYNISLYGLERLHSFDSRKYGNVENYLKNQFGIHKNNLVKPRMVTNEELLSVHTQRYLNSLKNSATIAGIVGISCLRFVPNWFLQRYLLRPMKLATGGTVQAAQLALRYGWAINLGGGYHHAKGDSGGGFCVYADICIAVEKLWKKDPSLRIMVVDLDAHQGNGHEAIFASDSRVSIFDMYNADMYPWDEVAKEHIRFDVPLRSNIGGDDYIDRLKKEINSALDTLEEKDEEPNLIIYNAGTDPLSGDHIGRMNVSAEKMIERDEIVFKHAQERRIPIVYLFSGGYTKESANVIGRSLENILENYVDLAKNQNLEAVPRLFQ